MNQYYLMAQLPSLDGLHDAAPLPITEERFAQLCQQLLGKRIWNSFRDLTLVPDRDGDDGAGNKLSDDWNRHERQLRLALGVYRAEKLQKPFEARLAGISDQLRQAARTAVQIEDPMEAERFLNEYRMAFLETLRPADPFAGGMVYYYGLKLKLLTRIRSFDEGKGREAYRMIYDSILHGD